MTYPATFLHDLIANILADAKKRAEDEMHAATMSAQLGSGRGDPLGGVRPSFSERQRDYLIEQAQHRALGKLRRGLRDLAFPE